MKRILATLALLTALVVPAAPADAHRSGWWKHCNHLTAPAANYAGAYVWNTNGNHMSCGFRLTVGCERYNGTRYLRTATRYLYSTGAQTINVRCDYGSHRVYVSGTYVWQV